MQTKTATPSTDPKQDVERQAKQETLKDIKQQAKRKKPKSKGEKKMVRTAAKGRYYVGLRLGMDEYQKLAAMASSAKLTHKQAAAACIRMAYQTLVQQAKEKVANEQRQRQDGEGSGSDSNDDRASQPTDSDSSEARSAEAADATTEQGSPGGDS